MLAATLLLIRPQVPEYIAGIIIAFPLLTRPLQLTNIHQQKP